MPKVLPKHRQSVNQLGWDEFYNILTTKQQANLWTFNMGSPTFGTINSDSVENYGDEIITITGDNVRVIADIRIPVDATLGASGVLRVRSNSGNVNGFRAGVACYNSSDVFLGYRVFITGSISLTTAISEFNELIFDVGGIDTQFPADTSFIRPMMDWTTQSTFVELHSFVVRPLDNARKALYV